MTKKQKIWLSVFLAMFIVPEVLWSPVGNFYYEFYQGMKQSTVYPFRDNFLQHSDNLSILKIVVFIQCVGAALFLYVFWKHRREVSNQYSRWIIILLSLLLLILSGFFVYFSFSFSPDIL